MKKSPIFIAELYPKTLFLENLDIFINSQVECFDLEIYNDHLKEFILQTQKSTLKGCDFKTAFEYKKQFIQEEFFDNEGILIKDKEEGSVEIVESFIDILLKKTSRQIEERNEINRNYADTIRIYKNYSQYIGLLIFFQDELVNLLDRKVTTYDLHYIKHYHRRMSKIILNIHKNSKYYQLFTLSREKLANHEDTFSDIVNLNAKMKSFYEIINWKIFFLEMLKVVEAYNLSLDNLSIKFEVNGYQNNEIFKNKIGSAIFEAFVTHKDFEPKTNAFSYIFNALRRDGYIKETFINSDYIEFINREYKVRISAVVALERISSNKLPRIYVDAKLTHGGNFYF